jgi:hypothetical protein
MSLRRRPERIKSRRKGRANCLGAQASLPARFGQSVIAGNPAGKDACAPRQFALTLQCGISRKPGKLPVCPTLF